MKSRYKRKFRREYRALIENRNTVMINMAALYYSVVILVYLLAGSGQTCAQISIDNPYVIQNYLREVLPLAEKTECQKHLSALYTNFTDNWALKSKSFT